MKKLSISIIAICFLIACGGGGYGSNENPNNPTPYQGLQGIDAIGSFMSLSFQMARF